MARGVRLSTADLMQLSHRGMVPRDVLTPAPKRATDADGMNKLERRFWGEALRLARGLGGVQARFGSIGLRIGARCIYWPDFEIIPTPAPQVLPIIGRIDRITYVETKGFWRDDARVKIKAAAARYPERRFVAVTWDRRAGWRVEEIACR